MILADENIDARIVSTLRSKKIDVFYIKEGFAGISDAEVIKISKNPARIILTEDKDFGEWVYAHHEKEISLILLRYSTEELYDVIDVLLNLLVDRGDDLFSKFTTITSKKIRIRSLKSS